MKQVTAIVISFLRPAYTVACIRSLRKTYPDIKIIVGDNGGDDGSVYFACEEVGAKLISLPFDSGVCVARNELLKHVETRYVLVGDDDFKYDENARVDSMTGFLNTHEEYDLIGGRIIQDGIIRNYQGFIEKNSTHFITTKIDVENAIYKSIPDIPGQKGLRYCSADLTFNYFVARTDKVKEVPWDEEIKVAYEHFSWFWDFKCAGGKVAFTPDAIVIHKPTDIRAEVYGSTKHSEYMAFRNRKEDKARFFGKYNIQFTIGMTGAKTYAPNHIIERRGNDTKFVDFCITTFKRPDAIKKLLSSIAEIYPMANIYVADQNEVFDREFYKKLRNDLYDIGLLKRPSIEHLPYDCGLSYARNHLVLTTPNKYKLILDDDFEFTNDTDIGKMVRLLDAFPRVGIVGGKVRQLGHDLHFEFTPEIVGNTVVHKTEVQKWKKQDEIKYRRTGCVLNFALMRKELFQFIQWDSALKVTEHIDFYLRMKDIPFDIFYTPDVVVEHPPAERNEDYRAMRRRDQFIKLMFKKHGITKSKHENGQVTELLADGSIKRYKENTNG